LTINNKNIQTYVKLPKSIIKIVDKEAEKEFTSRSSRLAKIIIEHYQEVEGK
jgi:hypothetical protein